jgi:hypothetical protein
MINPPYVANHGEIWVLSMLVIFGEWASTDSTHKLEGAVLGFSQLRVSPKKEHSQVGYGWRKKECHRAHKRRATTPCYCPAKVRMRERWERRQLWLEWWNPTSSVWCNFVQVLIPSSRGGFRGLKGSASPLILCKLHIRFRAVYRLFFLIYQF